MPRRGRGRAQDWKRHGGPQPLPKEIEPRTSYDESNMPLRCMHCGEIFNGPFRGQKVKQYSPEYREIDRQTAGISDVAGCSKKSCIEANIAEAMIGVRAHAGDRDPAQVDALETRMRERAYADRENLDMFPQGLIDDLEGSE